jgi:hypothetical protein
MKVHEVDVAKVEDHALVAAEQAIHGLAHSRRGCRVDLALDAHDLHATEVVDGDFEWVWANPGGQCDAFQPGANIHPLWRNGND